MEQFFSYIHWQAPGWLFWLLVISFLIQAFYYLFFYLKFLITSTEQSQEKEDYPGVSVIIAARDEANNLEKFLPQILEQDYPEYQVVVVNHASRDGSDIVLKRFAQKYKHLYVTTIPYSEASLHTKKFALTIGIKAAKYDILLFTDADCRPVSKNWIKRMVRHFDDKTKIVLGYGGYEKGKGLLDKWIRTDTVFIAMQYFGFALRRMPYMGVGRNMAYRKSFFEEKGGFQSHFFEPSGSDDIFVNHNATKENTKCEFSPDSFTLSRQPRRWKEWLMMKKRHLGASKFYKTKFKLLLGLEPLSRILFFFSVVVSFVLINFKFWVFFIFFTRELMVLIVFYFASRKLHERNLWWFSLLYDIVQPFVSLITYIDKKQSKIWT